MEDAYAAKENRRTAIVKGMHWLKKNVTALLVIALIACNVYSFFYMRYELQRVKDKVNMAGARQEALQAETAAQASLDAYQSTTMLELHTIEAMLLSNKAEAIVAGCKTAEEKALAIGAWCAANISNLNRGHYENGESDAFANSVFGWLAQRRGLCHARASIAVEMCKAVGLPARVYNIYDISFGHSCLEVFYDKKWHFIDATYEGVFRDAQGELMRFEEMIARPAEAIKGMLVFEDTIDYNSNETPVDNDSRMHFVYTEESLANVRSSGVLSRDNPIVCYAPLDMSSGGEYRFGAADASPDDVRPSGYEQRVCSYLGYALGNGGESNLLTEWEFSNCEVGATYYIEYTVHYASADGLVYEAVPTNADVVSGERFVSAKTNAGTQETPIVWRIAFVPKARDCSVRIQHSIDDRNWCIVDCVRVGKQE